MNTDTHLLVNGFIRCGRPPGHMPTADNPDNATCPECVQLGKEGALQPGPVMQAVHKGLMDLAKAVGQGEPVPELSSNSHMALAGQALNDGTTLDNLNKLTEVATHHFVEDLRRLAKPA